MGIVSPTLPVLGQPNSTEDNHTLTSLQTIRDEFNGNIDNSNVKAAAAIASTKLADGANIVAQGGINQSGTVRRGKANIATSESRTNAAYGTLTTPDQVASVVLPTDGLIAVVYQALWQESVAGAARAAIFIGANQLQVQTSDIGPVTQAGTTGGAVAAIDRSLGTWNGGLASQAHGAAQTADITTGQVVGFGNTAGANISFETNGVVRAFAAETNVGGPVYVFAAAGTYTVSVQFKASSGSVTGKNRKLWVWSMAFA